MNTRRRANPVLISCLLLATAFSTVLAVNVTKTNTKFCNCPTTHTPVCGDDSQTYLNKCIAECWKVKVVANTTCKAFKKDCTKSQTCNIGACQCGNLPFKPVCYRGLTWTNDCDAQCNTLCPDCKMKDGICDQPNKLGTCEPTVGGVLKPGDLKKTIDAATTFPPKTAVPKYNYAEALYKNYLYFESTRDGKQMKRRFAWRQDSCLNCKGDNGADLSKGYLEAGGSFLKMTQPISYTVAMIALSLYQYKNGYNRTQYTQDAVDAIKWGTDYLIAGHPNATALIAQFNDRKYDFVYFGPPELYDQYCMNGRPRPYSYVTNKVGQRSSEMTGEAAAALALAALSFKATGQDPVYIAKLRATAISVYNLATQYLGGMSSITDPLIKSNHAGLWNGQSYEDELAWASYWMWRLTRKVEYLEAARMWQKKTEEVQTFWSAIYVFDGKQHYPGTLTYLARDDPDPALRKEAQQKAKMFFDQYLTQSIPHTHKGMAYPFHWGACRVAANVAALALFHSTNPEIDPVYAAKLFTYGEFQIKYLLGDAGRSWMVGFGKKYPTYLWQKNGFNTVLQWNTKGKRDLVISKDPGPWTKDAGDGDKNGNIWVSQADAEFRSNAAPARVIVYGTLYGAPLQDDCMIKGRKDYSFTEPQIDGNAGLTMALSHLTWYYQTTHYKPCKTDLKLGWDHPKANPANQYPWTC